jgi:hypothetical protein
MLSLPMVLLNAPTPLFDFNDRTPLIDVRERKRITPRLNAA